jgi:hypothetical protein
MRIPINFTVMVAAVILFAAPHNSRAAQGKLAAAKSLRCTFQLNATGTWKKEGQPEAALKPATLVLQFDSINVDDGTARLRNGTMESEIIVRFVTGYLHLMQSFRSGPLYTTTVFDKATPSGKLKAVHSRHEYFETPLDGATSSPEQYYGECEVTN